MAGRSVIEYISKGPRYPNWTLGMQLAVDTLTASFVYMRPGNRLTFTEETFDRAKLHEAIQVLRNMPVDVSHSLGKFRSVDWETHANKKRDVLTKDIFYEEEFIPIADRIEKELTESRKLFAEVAVHDDVMAKLVTSGASEEEIFDLSPLSKKEVILVHYHGGSYCHLCPGAYRRAMFDMSKATGYRVFVPDYRLAPDHPFPAGVLDGAEFYFYLLDRGFEAKNIIIMGDSAGGNLVLVLLEIFKRANCDQPRGCIPFSPWSDLNPSADSYQRNKKYDFLTMGSLDNVLCGSRLYLAPGEPLGEKITNLLKNPLVSPVYGSFDGCAPIYMQSGEVELLVDEIDEMSKVLNAKERFIAGPKHGGFTDAQKRAKNIYEKYSGMVHIFFIIQDAAETYAAIEGVGNFARKLESEHQN
ncbi:hypothetical protein BB560_002952 [Smittium megazygosporum]|uniref:Alpha/beta hydrolase fold-3 domain-containing protein n=1 Tax=Smittium megazygosporum TaxID=133381 RepID=A0A2T9ZDC8_9FUNG|nr:hypothetical protein BB560_002952 [Smittium megazygosporum]